MRLEHLLSGARDLTSSHRSVAEVPVSGQSGAVGGEYGERQKSPTPAHAQCIAVEHRLSVSTDTERVVAREVKTRAETPLLQKSLNHERVAYRLVGFPVIANIIYI